jgi:catechol 2,3-dioxygenase-like lactoylglutathione lyase family enzyme
MSTIVTGVDFVVVATKDIKAAEEFYGGVLGLPVGARYGRSPGVEFETGNLTIAVMEAEAFGMKFAANPSPIALQVDDTHAARAELESKGVEFAADTIDSGVCHMAIFLDPNGNALMLHRRYAPRGEG